MPSPTSGPDPRIPLRERKPESVPSALLDYVPAYEATYYRKGKASFRLLFAVLCLAFFLMLLWAAFAEIDEVVAGMGQVIPSQRVQHIQNLEGGILRELLVREGEQVDKGALLLRIDNETAGSEYRDALTRSLELEASIARLRAELDGGEPQYSESLLRSAPELIARHNSLLEAERAKSDTTRKALQAQLELRKLDAEELLTKQRNLTASLSVAVRQRDLARKLMASRSYSEMEFLHLEQQVLSLQGELAALESGIPRSHAAIREAEERLGMVKAERDAAALEKLNQATAELAALRELLVAGADRVSRTEVRSPVRGIVKSINITTTGGVILPGEVILDVVPLDDSLIVEARISPQDIAFLFVGQKAKVRLSSYDFAIYGALDATLEHIGADTVQDPQGGIYYQVHLRTDRSSLRYNGRELPILPGMLATVDIMTGKKTVLDYLLKPILKAKQTALRER